MQEKQTLVTPRYRTTFSVQHHRCPECQEGWQMKPQPYPEFKQLGHYFCNHCHYAQLANKKEV